MVIRWDSESDWKSSQDSSGTTGRNGELKQGYSRERPDLSDGLVGYWPLHDENAVDYSGNDNHGAMSGNIVTGVAGRGGLQAMSFDGSNDYVNLSNLNNEFNTSPPATFTAWIKTSKTGTPQTVIGSINSSSTRNGTMVISTNGNLGYYDTNGTYESSLNVSDGNWHFIAVVDDGTDVTYYVDEQKEKASGDSDGWDGGDYWSIGRREAGPGWYLQGTLSMVRAYSRALSESEIQTLYEWGSGDFARPPNQDDGGISYWPLDGNSTDVWGDGNGSSTDVVFENGIRDLSGSFNGSSSEISTNQNPDYDWSQYNGLTFVAWVKPTSNPQPQDYAMIFDSGFGNGTLNGYSLEWRPSTPYGNVAAGEELAVNEWTMLTMTVDDVNGVSKIYYNTVQKGKATGTSGQLTDNRYFAIGDNVDGSNNDTFDGLIDEVRLYGRKLEQSDIFELYRYGTKGRDLRKQLVNY